MLYTRCAAVKAREVKAGSTPAVLGGSGGNKIVVNKNVAPTVNMSGLAVSTTNGGSISITRSRTPASAVFWLTAV